MRTVKHTGRFRRDYKREKSGRQGKRLDAELLGREFEHRCAKGLYFDIDKLLYKCYFNVKAGNAIQGPIEGDRDTLL
jgi:hypothetical protein